MSYKIRQFNSFLIFFSLIILFINSSLTSSLTSTSSLFNFSSPSFIWTPELVEEYRKEKTKNELTTFISLISSHSEQQFLLLLQKIQIIIYVIGKENSPKILTFKKVMKSIGIENYEIININTLPWQVDRKTLIDRGIIPSNYYTTRYKFLLSLTLSHEDILRSFLKTNGKHLWIMEDDVTISQGLTTFDVKYILTSLFSLQIPKLTWDLAYPGYCYATKSILKYKRGKQEVINDVTSPKSSNSMIYPCVAPMCSHSIIYSRPAVEFLLNNLRPFHIAYDGIIQHLACKAGHFFLQYLLMIFLFSSINEFIFL